MTGFGVKQLLNTKYDEAGSPYWDSTKLNRFLKDGLLKILEREYQSFQQTTKISDEMQQLLIRPTAIVPVANVINITLGTGTPADYWHLAALKCKFTVSGTVYYNFATVLRTGEQANFYSGTVQYPMYEYTANALTIYPTSVACTEATMTYFKIPVFLDVDDNTTVLPYTQKTLNLLIDETITQMSVSTREYNQVKVEQEQVKINP